MNLSRFTSIFCSLGLSISALFGLHLLVDLVCGLVLVLRSIIGCILMTSSWRHFASMGALLSAEFYTPYDVTRILPTVKISLWPLFWLVSQSDDSLWRSRGNWRPWRGVCNIRQQFLYRSALPYWPYLYLTHDDDVITDFWRHPRSSWVYCFK